MRSASTTIGAVVSSDLIFVALQLIVVGSIGIMLWITYRFRDVKMGVTALISLLHDVIVVVGIFAILGTLFGVKIDGLFVTAMLSACNAINRERHSASFNPQVSTASGCQSGRWYPCM